RSRTASTAPVSSSSVSPLIRRPTRRAAMAASEARPSTISATAPRASAADRERPAPRAAWATVRGSLATLGHSGSLDGSGTLEVAVGSGLPGGRRRELGGELLEVGHRHLDDDLLAAALDDQLDGLADRRGGNHVDQVPGVVDRD